MFSALVAMALASALVLALGCPDSYGAVAMVMAIAIKTSLISKLSSNSGYYFLLVIKLFTFKVGK